MTLISLHIEITGD